MYAAHLLSVCIHSAGAVAWAWAWAWGHRRQLVGCVYGDVPTACSQGVWWAAPGGKAMVGRARQRVAICWWLVAGVLVMAVFQSW